MYSISIIKSEKQLSHGIETSVWHISGFRTLTLQDGEDETAGKDWTEVAILAWINDILILGTVSKSSACQTPIYKDTEYLPGFKLIFKYI